MSSLQHTAAASRAALCQEQQGLQPAAADDCQSQHQLRLHVRPHERQGQLHHLRHRRPSQLYVVAMQGDHNLLPKR